MRVLDRYVFLLFLKAFVGALITFSIGAVLLDFFMRLGYFVDYAEKVEGSFASEYSRTEVVLLFYLAYLPYILKQVMPFITVAASFITLLTLLRGNEIMPVLAAGTSARRLLAPVFVCGLLVSLALLCFQEFVVPSLNSEHIRLKRLFAGDRRAELYNLAHIRDGKGTVVRAGSYRLFPPSLRDVVIQRPWEETGFETWIVDVLEADGNQWRAPRGGQVLPPGAADPLRRLPEGAVVDIGVTPEEVETLIAREGTAEISFAQLAQLQKRFPDRRALQVALYQQLAQPFNCFLLLLVIVPTLVNAGRKVIIGGGSVFLASAGFYFLSIFCTSMGDRGDLPPLIAAYFPAMLYLSIGVARLATIRT